jgi:hypothetical protein
MIRVAKDDVGHETQDLPHSTQHHDVRFVSSTVLKSGPLTTLNWAADDRHGAREGLT